MRSAVGFGQGLAGFLENAGFDQERPSLGGSGGRSADKLPHLDNVLLGLRPADRGKTGGHAFNVAKD
jgi:hypothetical protein